MAIRLCIFTAHESRCTENPQQHIPPSSLLHSVLLVLCHSVAHSHLFSFRRLSVITSPVLYHFSFIVCLSLCLDPALYIPSCLIKTCIINTAISLSILLPCSYDCYIKCKLFRCNSLLMSLLQSVFPVCRGKGGKKKR